MFVLKKIFRLLDFFTEIPSFSSLSVFRNFLSATEFRLLGTAGKAKLTLNFQKDIKYLTKITNSR
jgi:hypothetical protein